MAKLKGSKKPKNKNQLLLANEAQYPSSPDRKDWMNEIYIPENPKPGDVLFNEEELPGGAKQLGFQWLVKQLQINKNKKNQLAMAPRLIKGGVVPNAIIRAPNLDSNVITNWKNRGGTKGMQIPKPGVQLFPIKPL